MGKAKHASYEDYINLIKDTFGEIKRDIFTGDCHVYDTVQRRWVPLLASMPLGKLRSKIRDIGEGWSVSALEDHIYSATMDHRGEMLIEIPPWDGLERIKVFAQNLVCESFTPEEVEDIMKEWGANMFRRLKDPAGIQNRIVILLGKQGLGKDTWIKQMLRDLEHYLVSFVVTKNEVDTLQLVTSSLCCHIEEFDRTHKQDPGTIKAIITGESFQFRAAYERKAERKKDRASFIASCNTSNILSEPGANRRFIVLDVEDIGRTYPMGESKQVLAEWKYLSTEGYKIRDETNQTIARVIAELTPVDIEEEVVNAYIRLCREDPKAQWETDPSFRICALSSCMGDIWKDLAKETGHTIQTVRNIIKRKGYGKHTRDGTKYYKDPLKGVKGKGSQVITTITSHKSDDSGESGVMTSSVTEIDGEYEYLDPNL